MSEESIRIEIFESVYFKYKDNLLQLLEQIKLVNVKSEKQVNKIMNKHNAIKRDIKKTLKEIGIATKNDDNKTNIDDNEINEDSENLKTFDELLDSVNDAENKMLKRHFRPKFQKFNILNLQYLKQIKEECEENAKTEKNNTVWLEVMIPLIEERIDEIKKQIQKLNGKEFGKEISNQIFKKGRN